MLDSRNIPYYKINKIEQFEVGFIDLIPILQWRI